jgi:hypothetical protein
MKTPADGWDREERDAIDALREELEALQARHHNDPGIDLLRAGHHDALPPDLQRRVADRLTNDPWARALVEGLDEAEPSFDMADQDRLLARIERDARRSEPSVRRWAWFRPALASAAVVAVVVSGWLVLRNSPEAPPVAPVPVEQTVASAPAPPAYRVPLDAPEITISLAAMTWRGAGDNPLLADLKVALDAFREGDYARADREFAALEPRYPDAIEVFFYGGVARLFVNDPQRAASALTRAGELADASFAPNVEWYRAIAEERTGNLAQARTRLDALCRGGSRRAEQACDAVRQIDATSRTPDTR